MTFWEKTLQAFDGRPVRLRVRERVAAGIARSPYVGILEVVGPTTLTLRAPDGSTLTIAYDQLLECTEHKETDE